MTRNVVPKPQANESILIKRERRFVYASMNGDNLHPLEATHCAHEERTATSGASRSAQDTFTINNAPQMIRRPAADAIGTSQGRGRAHTLPHDYCAQSNSPGCERRRRRQRLAHQYAHTYAAAAAGRPSAAPPIIDITSTDSALGPSETFPPSPCRPSLHARRRLQSLDGGLAMEGVDADLTCSEPQSAFNGGHVQPSQSEAAGRNQITGCGRSSIGRNKRWRNSSPPFQKLASITAAVVMVCVMVTVLTTDSYHRNQRISNHRKAPVSSSHTATKEYDPINAGRYDPEVRFLPGMRMEIISEANAVQDDLKGGGEDRDPALASPKTQRGERPDLSPRAAQRTGNGRKKRRPRLAHARASFDPIIHSQDAADNGTSRESGLRGQGKIQEKKTPKRKLPTFVLPPEETQQDNMRDSLQNIEAVERAYSMSWSKVFVLVAMTVLCVQLLASLRRAY